jgi:tetratricopeptide (TPR) repeat protein
MRVTVAAQARKSVDIVMEIAGNPSAGNPPPRSKDASSIASPEFYDEPAFKPGPLASSGEAAGYSAGSQGEVAHRLLADFMNMPEDAGKELQSLSHPEGSTTADRSLSSKEYEAAVEKEPSEANFFAWGDALLRQNAYAKAEKAFSRGVQRYHTSLRLQLALAVAQYLRGDYAKSVNILILASDSAPSDYRPYILLGKAYSGAMVPESAQAIETLRRFMQVQPQNALAHYYFALGLSKGVRGKNDESRWAEVEAALERAQKLDPQLADAHLLLGSTYEERGRLAEAVAQYEQTARLRPDLPAAHYRLSKLYLRQGDKARADAELAKFEKLTHPN